MTDLPDHVLRNRNFWDALAPEYVQRGRAHWAQDEPAWGMWQVPESELRILPPSPAGLDVIELGCGTAYVSAWLARRGGRPVGIDNSQAQLEAARGFQREFGLEFPLIHGSAEAVPLADAAFDLALSEHGASSWCDPYLWIPEAARLLRPGGRLVFMVSSVLLTLCLPDQAAGPATDHLVRPSFGMHRIEWADRRSVNFQLNHGEMIRLLRSSGFEIEDLIEVRPGEDATTRYDFVTLEWARRWPCEEVWKARRA